MVPDLLTVAPTLRGRNKSVVWLGDGKGEEEKIELDFHCVWHDIGPRYKTGTILTETAGAAVIAPRLFVLLLNYRQSSHTHIQAHIYVYAYSRIVGKYIITTHACRGILVCYTLTSNHTRTPTILYFLTSSATSAVAVEQTLLLNE